jgi:serine/threonine-protein kinase
MSGDSQRLASGVGTWLGRYQMLADLGSGGMASVHLARVVGPGPFRKLVALKRIHPHLTSRRDVVEMFLDEASIAGRISHPNTCGVVDFGEIDGTWYLAMEYLEGAPLSAVLKASARYVARDPEAVRDHVAVLCRVAVDACKGLHGAHEALDERGRPLAVVHRDVSPDNVFVTHDGVAKVMDFGIATGRGRIHQTSLGIMKGKTGYLAPESFAEGAVDRRVDVWAVGVVLWEGLCRERLFHRSTPAQTMSAILTGRVPPPSERRPEIPGSLDRVVLRALERDPARRWPTAAALGEALEEACAEAGLVASEAGVVAWMDRVMPGHRAALRAELARALGDNETAEIVLPRLPDAVTPTPVERRAAGGAAPAFEGPAGEAHAAPRRRPVFWSLVAAAMLAVGATSYWVAGLAGVGAAAPRVSGATAALIAGTPEPTVASPPRPAPEAGVDVGVGVGVGVGVNDGAVAVSPPPPAAADAAPPPDEARPAGGFRPKRPRPVAAEPASLGDVRIATPGGWAEVYHGGRRLASHTPATVRLPPGRQVIELRFGGGAERRRVAVEVSPDRQAVVVERAP